MQPADYFFNWKNRTPDRTIRNLASASELSELLITSNNLANFNLINQPINEINVNGRINKLNNVSFSNASFNHSIFKEITFNKCEFRDCYFVGGTFEDCEFHGCTFENCNLWKVKIRRSYLNPVYLKNNFKKWKYANVASDTFQELFKNAKKEEIINHAERADFYYRKWSRRYLPRKFKENEVNFFQFLKRYLISWLYQWLLGYGYRITNLSITSTIIFTVFCIVNFNKWNSLGIVLPENVQFDKSVINVIFLTFRNMTAFDFAGFYCTTDIGKILSIVEGIFGYLILGYLISMIFKKISR